jgi:hypothetical protein
MAGILGLPSLDLLTNYIRQRAPFYGIDPDIALKVAQSEGLKPGTWQSDVVKNGKREPSYGPFQLYMGGGLGNDMLNQTGVDPSDPNNWQQGVDFALNTASKKGWGPWYGAKRVGITGKMGIGEPMALAGPQDDLPTMPPTQMPFDQPTGGMEEPSIAQLQRDFIPPMQSEQPQNISPPVKEPVMADATADPVSQLLAQYLSQSGGQSQGLLGQIFPGLNKTRVGGLLNNSDLQNKLMSIGAGLASGRGWGPGFGAGVGMYMQNRQNDIENQRADLMTKLGLAKALSPSTEFQTLKRDDGSEGLVAITKPAFGGEPTIKPYDIPGMKTNDTTVADIGKAIKEGRQPPVLTGLYSKAAPVRAWLERNGVDLTSANLDWQKATKQIAALNGPQMTRYAGLAKSVLATITDVKDLAKELDQGGFSDYNKAKLEYLVRVRGNTPEGILATRYLAATTLLEEEIANLAQGGGVPTEPAFELAKKQIQGGYGSKQITASLEEVERLLNYRLQAIPNMGSLGPDSANRYTNNPGTPPGIHDPAVTGAPPPPPGFVVQP